MVEAAKHFRSQEGSVSAALLSALPAESALDQTTLARFLLALHPFRAACLVAQWSNDPIKTVIHRENAALVLDESEHLRQILTVEEFENGRTPFWVYREQAKRKENHAEVFWRNRINKTQSTPCWHGEEKPKGYRKVKLTTIFPSVLYLMRLASLEYPWCAVEAALPQAHNPWMRPVADRRAHGVIDNSEDDDNGEEKTGLSKRDSHEIVDVAHPYIPTAPGRRTLVGGGIPLFQVTREIAKHRWDDVTSSCVLAIVYRRQSPSELSELHGIPPRRLREYARLIRKAIRSDPRNDFAQ